jgi:hypothetical protein
VFYYVKGSYSISHLLRFAVAPLPGILEKPQPGGSMEQEIPDLEFPILFPFFGYPGPLPEQK